MPPTDATIKQDERLTLQTRRAKIREALESLLSEQTEALNALRIAIHRADTITRCCRAVPGVAPLLSANSIMEELVSGLRDLEQQIGYARDVLQGQLDEIDTTLAALGSRKGAQS